MSKARANAVNMSSMALPLAAVKDWVIGSMAARAASADKTVRTCISAAPIVVELTAPRALAFNPENQVFGFALARFATSRSVSGVIFTVPTLVAIEW